MFKDISKNIEYESYICYNAGDGTLDEKKEGERRKVKGRRLM